MSSPNFFGDYSDENASPEIIEDKPIQVVNQNIQEDYHKQIEELKSENLLLNKEKEKHYQLILKLEEEICKYQRELEISLGDFNEYTNMLEECDQRIQTIDKEIEATTDSIEGIKDCSKYVLKLLQYLKSEKAIDYQNFLKLKEIYYIYIENINDIIKEIKDEQIQIEIENHIANQNAKILQIDKQYLEIDIQIKKIKEENEVYEKNYK